MGFFESKVFQDIIALFVIAYFGLSFFSMWKKQTVRDTWLQIKEWYQGLDGEVEEDG